MQIVTQNCFDKMYIPWKSSLLVLSEVQIKMQYQKENTSKWILNTNYTADQRSGGLLCEVKFRVCATKLIDTSSPCEENNNHLCVL